MLSPTETSRSFGKSITDLWMWGTGWGSFIAALRQYYTEDDRLPSLVNSTPKISLTHCFVNLALIGQKAHERQEKISLSEKRISEIASYRDELHQSLLNSGKYHGIDELFDKSALENRSTPTGWACITGLPGTGKSSLLQFISHRWGLFESLWNERFEFVFRVKLNLVKQADFKSLPPNAGGIDCLAHLIFLSLERKFRLEDIRSCLIKHPERILLLLDGFDEIASLYGRGDSKVTALINNAMDFPNGILTSRPNLVDLALIPRFTERRFEILGLTEDQVRQYIQRYPFTEAGLTESLLNELSTNLDMLSLAQIPVNLSALCLTYELKIPSHGTSPIFTMTHLYHRVVLWLLKRYVDNQLTHEEKELGLKASGMSDAEIITRCSKELQTLTDLAYDAFQQNEIQSLSPQLLEQHFPEQTLLLTISEKLGFLRAFGMPEGDKAYTPHYFIHLTYQEYFTALHIVQKLSQPRNDSDREQEILRRQMIQNLARMIQKERNNPRYKVILTFVAGLLSMYESQHGANYFWDAMIDFSETPFTGIGLHPHAQILRDNYDICRETFMISAHYQRQLPRRLEILRPYLQSLLIWETAQQTQELVCPQNLLDMCHDEADKILVAFDGNEFSEQGLDDQKRNNKLQSAGKCLGIEIEAVPTISIDAIFAPCWHNKPVDWQELQDNSHSILQQYAISGHYYPLSNYTRELTEFSELMKSKYTKSTYFNHDYIKRFADDNGSRVARMFAVIHYFNSLGIKGSEYLKIIEILFSGIYHLHNYERESICRAALAQHLDKNESNLHSLISHYMTDISDTHSCLIDSALIAAKIANEILDVDVQKSINSGDLRCEHKWLSRLTTLLNHLPNGKDGPYKKATYWVGLALLRIPPRLYVYMDASQRRGMHCGIEEYLFVASVWLHNSTLIFQEDQIFLNGECFRKSLNFELYLKTQQEQFIAATGLSDVMHQLMEPIHLPRITTVFEEYFLTESLPEAPISDIDRDRRLRAVEAAIIILTTRVDRLTVDVNQIREELTRITREMEDKWEKAQPLLAHEKAYIKKFKQQLVQMYIVATVASTGSVQLTLTGTAGNAASVLNVIAGLVPWGGGAVQMFSYLLQAIDTRITQTRMERVTHLGDTPEEVAKIASILSQRLLHCLELENCVQDGRIMRLFTSLGNIIQSFFQDGFYGALFDAFTESGVVDEITGAIAGVMTPPEVEERASNDVKLLLSAIMEKTVPKNIENETNISRLFLYSAPLITVVDQLFRKIIERFCIEQSCQLEQLVIPSKSRSIFCNNVAEKCHEYADDVAERIEDTQRRESFVNNLARDFSESVYSNRIKGVFYFEKAQMLNPMMLFARVRGKKYASVNGEALKPEVADGIFQQVLSQR